MNQKEQRRNAALNLRPEVAETIKDFTAALAIELAAQAQVALNAITLEDVYKACVDDKGELKPWRLAQGLVLGVAKDVLSRRDIPAVQKGKRLARFAKM